MTRRTFMGAIAAVAAALGLKATDDGKYGYIHVDQAYARGLGHSTVLLDGVDVSKECFACDDKAGIVWMYQRDSSGRLYLDGPNHLAQIQRVGRVQFIPRRGRG